MSRLSCDSAKTTWTEGSRSITRYATWAADSLKPGEAMELSFPAGCTADEVQVVKLPRRADQASLRKAGLKFDIMTTSFFLGRRTLKTAPLWTGSRRCVGGSRPR